MPAIRCWRCKPAGAVRGALLTVAPQNAVRYKTAPPPVLKRFENRRVESWAETARVPRATACWLNWRTQRWQEQNIPALAQAVDDLFVAVSLGIAEPPLRAPAAGSSTPPAPVSLHAVRSRYPRLRSRRRRRQR